MRASSLPLLASVALLSVSLAHAADPVAVVELFTSEGCSSCPPADALLGRLVEEAESHGEDVLCLAFHVDYWDGLGWPDPFADPRFSARQRRYAEALGEDRIYTPQAVVNGRWSMVGSDGRRLHAALSRALGSRAAARVDLRLSGEATSRRADVAVAGSPAGTVVHVAVVERRRSHHVGRGENSGRTLEHHNLVRTFRTVAPEEGRAVVDLELPAGVDPDGALVVAYAQDPGTMRILGGASAPFADRD
jgi:hypothetical protein